MISRLAGSPHRWGDYLPGERIDHVDGMTVEEAEHQLATRLYQNTAKVHFNQFTEGQGRFGRRLIYGGHVISLARALSFNGLANAFHIAAINGGRHVSPLFAGLTVFAWTEVLERAEIHGRDDVGALRLRTIATKDQPTAAHPVQAGRRLRSERHSRSRLLGADPALRRRARKGPRDHVAGAFFGNATRAINRGQHHEQQQHRARRGDGQRADAAKAESYARRGHR